MHNTTFHLGTQSRNRGFARGPSYSALGPPLCYGFTHFCGSTHQPCPYSPPFLRLVPRLWTDLTGRHPACCCSVQYLEMDLERAPLSVQGKGKPHNCSSCLCPRHWGVGIGERLCPLGFGPAVWVPQYQDRSPLMPAYACSAAPHPCHTSRAGLKLPS